MYKCLLSNKGTLGGYALGKKGRSSLELGALDYLKDGGAMRECGCSGFSGPPVASCRRNGAPDGRWWGSGGRTSAPEAYSQYINMKNSCLEAEIV